MSGLDQLKERLDLVRPEACGDCVEQCTAFNAGNDEGLVCLRAVAEARNGDVRRIADFELRELLQEPRARTTIAVRYEALKFIFSDFDQRYPEE